MSGICIAYYTLDEGFGIASFDCGHWAQLGNVTLKLTKCPVCAQIKAAEKKRGEEVLKLACGIIKSFRERIPESLMSTPTIVSLQATENDIRQAYKERYEQG